MKMADIRSGFSKFSPVGLLALLNNVIDKLTENASIFTDVPVPVAMLSTLATAFNASINKANKGSAASRATRDNKAAQVRAALLPTAEYVRMVAVGDPEVLHKSGFELAKQREPVGNVGTPLMKSVKMTGLTGEVELTYSGRPGARSFTTYQTDTDPTLPGTVWTSVLSTTKVRCKVGGLVPYKAYWFAVQALGAEGPGAMSDPMIGRAA